MRKLPSQLKSALGVIVWFTFFASFIFKHPEHWDAWKGMGVAFLLTILACVVAILLSGQYRQDNGK